MSVVEMSFSPRLRDTAIDVAVYVVPPNVKVIPCDVSNATGLPH
jgi:hypothetical protein